MKSTKRPTSILDARPLINWRLLFTIKLLVAIGGGCGFLYCLYVADWQHRHMVAGIIASATLITLVVLVFVVDNINTGSRDADMIRRSKLIDQREQVVQRDLKMSYDELVKRGQHLQSSGQVPTTPPPRA